MGGESAQFKSQIGVWGWLSAVSLFQKGAEKVAWGSDVQLLLKSTRAISD
jgi:hypothetical protein